MTSSGFHIQRGPDGVDGITERTENSVAELLDDTAADCVDDVTGNRHEAQRGLGSHFMTVDHLQIDGTSEIEEAEHANLRFRLRPGDSFVDLVDDLLDIPENDGHHFPGLRAVHAAFYREPPRSESIFYGGQI